MQALDRRARHHDETTAGASLIVATGSARWVVVVVGRGDLRVVPLDGDRGFVIGRGVECELPLDHHRVSRRHARLDVVDDAKLSVEDLGSRNGTVVAGRTIEPNARCVVRPGDPIVIRPFTLIAAREPVAEPSHAALVVDDPRADMPTLATVARSAASVLIRGESGSGKQLLAETLHRLSGRSGRLVSINCAAIGHELLESELFGHERGAFTGAVAAKPGLLEVAGEGTVLFDEIGDMPAALQAKLLRAVESREVLRVGGTQPVTLAARFVSATHHDLLAAVEAGAFRLDLYYRLAGVTLTIPPLRERRRRLLAIARELLDAAAARDRRSAPVLSAAAAARLCAHDWPGNVRELRNVLDRALILADATIEPAHVVFDAFPEPRHGGPAASVLRSAAEEAERARIVEALAACHGNQTRAAKLLGMSRSTLATKLAIHRLPRPRKP